MLSTYLLVYFLYFLSDALNCSSSLVQPTQQQQHHDPSSRRLDHVRRRTYAYQPMLLRPSFCASRYFILIYCST
ncbi:hypothetical protein GGR58DRAFT_474498 [Xylaria digitata]|nr:hypothetical protein GGR58DRAFT_474498 [Xylaria digitata]